MASPALDFVILDKFTDGTSKSAYLKHVQALCTGKAFKDKTKHILEWAYEHNLAPKDPVLKTAKAKEWETDGFPVCTALCCTVHTYII